MKATDGDSGINALLNYTFLPGEYEEIFSIDSSSGNITIIGDLDRERISSITLHVQVTDGKFIESTDLFITVLDFRPRTGELKTFQKSFLKNIYLLIITLDNYIIFQYYKKAF